MPGPALFCLYCVIREFRHARCGVQATIKYNVLAVPGLTFCNGGLACRASVGGAGVASLFVVASHLVLYKFGLFCFIRSILVLRFFYIGIARHGWLEAPLRHMGGGDPYVTLWRFRSQCYRLAHFHRSRMPIPLPEFWPKYKSWRPDHVGVDDVLRCYFCHHSLLMLNLPQYVLY